MVARAVSMLELGPLELDRLSGIEKPTQAATQDTQDTEAYNIHCTGSLWDRYSISAAIRILQIARASIALLVESGMRSLAASCTSDESASCSARILVTGYLANKK